MKLILLHICRLEDVMTYTVELIKLIETLDINSIESFYISYKDFSDSNNCKEIKYGDY